MTKFAVAILLALTMPADAADMANAKCFLPGCKGWLDKNRLNPSEATRQGLCAGFVTGLAFGITGKDTCLPERVTNN